MFMGLTEPMVQGESFPLTLTFEQAGEMVIEVPVDLERKPGVMSHGKMGHGKTGH
jgi:copper(I)-binding protein